MDKRGTSIAWKDEGAGKGKRLSIETLTVHINTGSFLSPKVPTEQRFN